MHGLLRAFISHVLQIGIFLVYCVPSDFRALDTLFMLETKPSSIAGDVTACGSPGQADIAAGTSSRLPILLLFVVASLHMALVAIYFTQLGYPPSDPVTQKADEDGNDESNTRLTTGTHETPSQNTSQNTLGAVSPILMRISSSRPTAKRWNDEEDDSILITVEEARDADEPQAGPVFSAYSTPVRTTSQMQVLQWAQYNLPAYIARLMAVTVQWLGDAAVQRSTEVTCPFTHLLVYCYVIVTILLSY